MITPARISLLALICAIPLLTEAAQQAETPAAVIEEFQNTLLSVMKNAKRLGYQSRYDRLAPAVRASHDLAAIAEISVGPYWDQFSRAQRNKLVNAFTKLSIATYASRFDGYSGQTFEIQSSEKASPHVASVSSIFRQPEGDDIHFDYLLRRSQGQWRIVNIVVDGVSDLALKRADYIGVLRTGGFNALMTKLKKQIADYTPETRASNDHTKASALFHP